MNIRQNAAFIVTALVLAIAAGFSAGRFSLPMTAGGQARTEAMAVDYYKQGETSQAFSLFRKLAEQGDASAAYYLGDMYEFGNGVPVDGEKAVKWLTVSAKAGNARAARQLGLLYLDGTVEVQDFARARDWLDAAAKSGDPAALRNLGDMNAKGFGAPADPVAAYAYYSVAALRGDGASATIRNQLAKTLTASQQKKGEAQAQEIRSHIASAAATPGTAGTSPQTATGQTSSPRPISTPAEKGS